MVRQRRGRTGEQARGHQFAGRCVIDRRTFTYGLGAIGLGSLLPQRTAAFQTIFCASPGDAGSGVASAFGAVIERIVEFDFCRRKVNGCTVFDPLQPSPAATDFLDRKTGIHPCRHMAQFLKLKNPWIDEAAITSWCEGMKAHPDDRSLVPDIITHQIDRKEFYEIKPDSRTGVTDGERKIRNFNSLCDGHQMDYLEGSQYSPHMRILVWDATWFSVPAKVYLEIYLAGTALIVYRFCVDAALLETLAKMLIAACVVGLLYLLSANPWLIPALAEVGAFLIAGTRSPMLGSVGQGGQQLPADARYAQRLLNDWRGANGLPAIAVDGDPRDETIGAITLFQQTVTGQVDGRLDPDGTAIRMLEQLHIQRMLDTPTLAYAEIDTQPDLSFDERASELSQADQEGSPPLDLAVALTGEAQAQLDALYALPA